MRRMDVVRMRLDERYRQSDDPDKLLAGMVVLEAQGARVAEALNHVDREMALKERKFEQMVLEFESKRDEWGDGGCGDG